ncbi:MAG: phosphatidylserine decarboxylase family protein, partial [Mycobacterium sp.]|nr:phosphatidylserine decarboxylase family protein [Mycobacterium sp.]
MARRPDDEVRSGPQRLAALVRSSVPPVHPAGIPFISAGLMAAALGRKHRWVRRAGLAAAAANA